MSLRIPLALLLALAACGDGGSGSSPAQPMTLAYLITECHEDARSASGNQQLVVVRGDSPPLVVAEIAIPRGRLPAVGLCPLYGAFRAGFTAAYALGFQRVGLSPDGSALVFEITFEFSFFRSLGVANPLTPEQEGIFFVRTDGTGLRRLGDPSREYSQRLGGVPRPGGPSVPSYIATFFAFSSDGKTIAFTDRVLGPGGEDAAQVVIVDIETGTRTAMTNLPPVTMPDLSNPTAPAIVSTFFLDDDTIAFRSRANPRDAANPQGLNPEGIFRQFSVGRDGKGLKLLPSVVPVAPPGSQVVTNFQITRPVVESAVRFLSVSGVPENPLPPGFNPPDAPVQELFVTGKDQVLQLTSFGRTDNSNEFLDRGGQRVFFKASTNRLGTNPSENCQIVSVSTLGDDLRQLTHLGPSGHSTYGCHNNAIDGTGCNIFGGPFWDSSSSTLFFESSCDPLGTNPAGEQIFAMRADGTGLRQLTFLRGAVTGADGSVDVELPGPMLVSGPNP